MDLERPTQCHITWYNRCFIRCDTAIKKLLKLLRKSNTKKVEQCSRTIQKYVTCLSRCQPLSDIYKSFGEK